MCKYANPISDRAAQNNRWNPRHFESDIKLRGSFHLKKKIKTHQNFSQFFDPYIFGLNKSFFELFIIFVRISGSGFLEPIIGFKKLRSTILLLDIKFHEEKPQNRLKSKGLGLQSNSFITWLKGLRLLRRCKRCKCGNRGGVVSELIKKILVHRLPHLFEFCLLSTVARKWRSKFVLALELRTH